ncbi:MAG: DNA ligase-1 [Oleispira sp.]|jgi:DNA ligase-1
MFKVFLFYAALLSPFGLMATEKPALMLANVLQKESGINLSHYWVSEKYDGVRALWDGKRFISRQGNEYHAPVWFIADLPNVSLDGELWLGRGLFDRLSGIVRKHKPIDEEWRQVRYMVFDLPRHTGTFDERLSVLQSLTERSSHQPSHLVIVPQWRVETEDELLAQLSTFVKNHAEGLMLHDGRSLYSAKRSDDLLKLKPSFDNEAIVTDYESGKGKYEGMMGALWVEIFLPNKEGALVKHTFKIGSGFSDVERQNPPAIGSEITFQYSGLTSKGKPRFARYLRVRQDF